MRARIIFRALLAIILFLMVTDSWGTSWRWIRNIIESVNHEGIRSSLVLDKDGMPHISHIAWSLPDDSPDSVMTKKALRYTYLVAGEGFTTVIVDSTYVRGDHSSVAIDNANNIHISYQGYRVANDTAFTGTTLKYAKGTARNTSDWDIHIIDDSGNLALVSAIAVDNAGNPHIVYNDIPSTSLKYAKWNGYDWEITELETCYTNSVSIAIDEMGNPHISYYYNPTWLNSHLRYAVKRNGSWEFQMADDDTRTGEFASIALDSDGNPHISYYDGPNQDLKYAYWDESSWQNETVDSGGDVGHCCYIGLDNSDRPHISYIDKANEILKYAYKDEYGWHIQSVDETNRVITGTLQQTSIEIDSKGQAHISYFIGTDWDLVRAWRRKSTSSSGCTCNQ